MNQLLENLDRLVFWLVLFCLVSVSFAFSFWSNHPFETIKELLFHFFVLLCTLLLVLQTLLTRTVPYRNNLLYFLVLIYLGYNAVSFLTSPYAERADFINTLLLISFFFVVAASVNSESRYQSFLLALAFIALVSSGYAFLQSVGYDSPLLQGFFGQRLLGRRVFSFFGNPNFFAAFLVTALPFLISGFFAEVGRYRYFFGIPAVFALASLFFTGTRAAFLGAGVALLLFFALTLGKTDKRRYLWVISATLILIVIGFTYVATATETGTRGLPLRQYWWHSALRIAQDHPFFGTGVGSFAVYYPAYREKSREAALGEGDQEMRLDHPHNEFLRVLSDLGIVGLILYVSIFLTFFYNFYAKWDPKKKHLLAGICCAVVGVLVHSLFSVSLRIVSVAMFFWLALALQTALLFEPKAKAQPSWTASTVVPLLVLLPLTALILNYSLDRFRMDHHMKEGLGFYAKQNFRVAELHFKKAVEYDSQAKRPLYFLGISQYRLKKFSESKETLSKLIDLDPNYVQSHYWLGANYLLTQDYENARKELEISLALNDSYNPSYYALGNILLRESKIEEALGHFERAYSYPGDQTTQRVRMQALERLIQVHSELGNHDQVASYRQKLRDLQQEP